MKEISSTLTFLGGALITLSLIILFLIFWPVILLEIGYFINGPGKIQIESQNPRNDPDIIVPLDLEFGIVIPKIRANAKLIREVNPFNEKEYQAALTRGVAHAKGTGYPDQGKNIFLFSHSSVNFYEAARYNSIFYLMDKLEKDDEVYVFYKNEKYKYKVTEKRMVDPRSISYLNINSNVERLTLMTCWPPGTTLKRLLVFAERAK